MLRRRPLGPPARELPGNLQAYSDPSPGPDHRKHKAQPGRSTVLLSAWQPWKRPTHPRQLWAGARDAGRGRGRKAGTRDSDSGL